MTFNEYINRGFNTYRLDEQKDKLINKLLTFTDNMIDSNTIDFTIRGYNLLTGWDIIINDDYTDDVFNTEQVILNRKLKLKKILQ